MSEEERVMWIAVKMDCFHPNGTVVRVYSEPDGDVTHLGSEWLVFQAQMDGNMGSGKLITH